MNLLAERYEPAVHSARLLLEHDPTLARLVDARLDPDLLLRFYMHYSALAVQITAPVESWIRRAGIRTRRVGLPEIGRRLIMHARHEANHHLMLIEDTRALVARWNRSRPFVDPDTLLRRPPTAAMQRYIALHEQTIASDMPYGQIAIELEIEGISVRYAPRLLQRLQRVLAPAGPATADGEQPGLSFLREHTALDIGHTELNLRLMSDLLAARPHAVARLAEIGAEALRIYVAFLHECFAMACSDDVADVHSHHGASVG